MKKLILFGDSLFGRVGKHLIVQLESKLENQFDVYNCAAGGWDSNDLVKKSEYIAGLKPDVTIISVGTNDVCSWKRVELDSFKQNTENLVAAFQDTQLIFFLPPPVHEPSRPAEKQIPNSDVKQYHDTIKIICEQHNLSYIDSWKVFMPLQDRDESYHIGDGVHLNDHGYQVLFDSIAEILA